MPRVQVYPPDDLHDQLKQRNLPASEFLQVALRAELRRRSKAGSAVDALVVAIAEPGGIVLTGDRADIESLAAHADGVLLELV